MSKRKIEVVYNIGAQFAGVGTGYTAYNAVRWGACKHGALKKLICLTYKNSEIPKEKITSFSWLYYATMPFRAIQMKMGWDWICPFYYRDIIFSILSSRHIGKCDIYHGWLGYSLSSIRKARKRGIITIVECASPHPRSELLREERNLNINEKSDEYTDSEKTLKSREEELESADYILIPSDFVEDSLIEKGIPKSKLLKIPFGVDLKKFAPMKKSKDKKFRAIFVGSVQLRKGIQYLLKAWDELNLKNAELIVVGRVWPDAQKVVKKYSSRNDIRFVGFDSDTKKYYEEADVFVLPSIEEGSALVSYEAMAMGLPLIVTYNTGSIARDGKDGFVVPIRDVEILKKKIKYFYDNPKEIERMGKSARKRVENYSWEQYGENLYNLYEKIARKKRVKL